MTISANNFRAGTLILKDNNPYQIISYKQSENTFIVHAKNIKTKQNETFEVNANESFSPVYLDTVEAQYTAYENGVHLFFDVENYAEYTIDKNIPIDRMQYVKEGSACKLVLFENKAVDVIVERFSKLQVISIYNNEATLETGAKIIVPNKVSVGDTIIVDTLADCFYDIAYY